MFHDGMRARVQLDDGDFSTWFDVCQGLRQGCLPAPLLSNIFFAGVIIVVLQRFTADPVTVSDLVYLDDAPKGADGMPREGTLTMVLQAACGILHADDARVASTSLRRLASMMDVIAVAYQEFGLTVSMRFCDGLMRFYHGLVFVPRPGRSAAQETSLHEDFYVLCNQRAQPLSKATQTSIIGKCQAASVIRHCAA